MAGFGFLLGGALKGYGDSKLEQAKAKREAALEERRWERQMAAAGEERKWRETEGEKDRAFRREEGELTRSAAEKRSQEEDARRAEDKERNAILDAVEKYQDEGMSREEAVQRAYADRAAIDKRKSLSTYTTPDEARKAGLKEGDEFLDGNGNVRRYIPPKVDTNTTGSTSVDEMPVVAPPAASSEPAERTYSDVRGWKPSEGVPANSRGEPTTRQQNRGQGGSVPPTPEEVRMRADNQRRSRNASGY
jgi:hypothetical protein